MMQSYNTKSMMKLFIIIMKCYCLALSRRVTHYSVTEDLNLLKTDRTVETFLKRITR